MKSVTRPARSEGSGSFPWIRIPMKNATLKDGEEEIRLRLTLNDDERRAVPILLTKSVQQGDDCPCMLRYVKEDGRFRAVTNYAKYQQEFAAYVPAEHKERITLDALRLEVLYADSSGTVMYQHMEAMRNEIGLWHYEWFIVKREVAVQREVRHWYFWHEFIDDTVVEYNFHVDRTATEGVRREQERKTRAAILFSAPTEKSQSSISAPVAVSSSSTTSSAYPKVIAPRTTTVTYHGKRDSSSSSAAQAASSISDGDDVDVPL